MTSCLSDQNASRFQRISFMGFDDLQLRKLIESLRVHFGIAGGHVENDRDRNREVFRNLRNDSLQRLRPSSRDADDNNIDTSAPQTQRLLRNFSGKTRWADARKRNTCGSLDGKNQLLGHLKYLFGRQRRWLLYKVHGAKV